MAIVEYQPNSVAADGFDPVDRHTTLAIDKQALTAAMALNLGRWREYAKVLRRHLKLTSVVKTDRKNLRALLQADLDGVGAVRHLEDVASQILVTDEFTKMLVDISGVDN